MKKVATVTFHRSDNFGSVLQAYALGEKLVQMGYDQYIIDYRKAEVANMYKILKKPTNKFLVITDIYNLLYYRKLKKRQKRFEKFRNDFFRLSNVYNSKEELVQAPPAADVYICGSDQIWNTSILDFDGTYLLDFVKSGRKISYAASGIKKTHTDEAIKTVSEAISSFDGVTVRETYTAKRLGIDYSNVVLDPVLLLTDNDWDKACADIKADKKYMLCYFAGNVSFEFEHFTKKYAEEKGLHRILLMPEWRNIKRSGKKSYDAGPREFLALIKNADIVCTDSFHGTAFSILFNKPFIVGQHNPFSDERIGTILSFLNLSDMEIDSACPVVPERLYSIDYTAVNHKLEKERARCTDILQKMIEGDVDFD